MIGPVWIAGGTTEGRKLAGYAARFQIKAYVSVATTYGASLLPVSPYITVLEGRMDRGEMEEFLREKGITLAIDATHPYATAVTDNIKGACQKAGVPYRRINRRAGTYRTLERALDLGYPPSRIIGMQGPFSEQLNEAMFKETKARYVVTKNSGHTGGFQEKLKAAERAGATVIIIER